MGKTEIESTNQESNARPFLFMKNQKINITLVEISRLTRSRWKSRSLGDLSARTYSQIGEEEKVSNKIKSSFVAIDTYTLQR